MPRPHQERGYRNDMLAHLAATLRGRRLELGLDSSLGSHSGSDSGSGSGVYFIFCHYI